jgi:tight adherence protein C
VDPVAMATVLVFVSTAVLSMITGAHFWARAARSMDRLGSRPSYSAALLPSVGLLWQELVEWAGGFLPASPKEASLLKRRLTRAGLRHPSAVRVFRGIQAISAMSLALGGLFIAWQLYYPPDRLWTIAAAAAFIGHLAPAQYLKAKLRRRKRAIERALPNALDLMVVCVESGLGLDQTIVQVAHELRSAFPEIADEFTVINLELRAGKRRAEALHDLGERTGVDDLKKLVAVLVQADRFGTGIAQSLRGHADYMRSMARQRAEEKASKIAVKLVFPIFFCILPSLFVVTVGPVIARLIRDLLPMIQNM